MCIFQDQAGMLTQDLLITSQTLLPSEIVGFELVPVDTVNVFALAGLWYKSPSVRLSLTRTSRKPLATTVMLLSIS